MGDVPRERRVLFLGRLTKKKQPDLLIRAWAKVLGRDDALLIVAGSDDDFEVRQLASLAERLGVASSVILPGMVVGGSKSWLYESCGIFVLPSENENFGLTVIEAMASGSYIVGSNDVAAMRYVGAADGGTLVSEVSEEEIARVIEELLSDPEAVIKGGKNCRAYARRELSWESTAEQIENRIRQELGDQVVGRSGDS
jgi:glycosyltransferase involved in cell wall biosynthesis